MMKCHLSCSDLINKTRQTKETLYVLGVSILHILRVSINLEFQKLMLAHIR